jgi:hypothetical protein
MSVSPLRLKPAQIIRAVSRLAPSDLNEFMLRFDEWQLARVASANPQVIRAVQGHRLPTRARARVSDLLTKNREAELTQAEERELDDYIVEMDRRLDRVADELTRLAKRHARARSRV